MDFRKLAPPSSVDRQIERAVWVELLTNRHFVGRRFVDVAVEQGVVSLSGFVDSYAQKWSVERAAARLVGVKDVRNYLDVLPLNNPSRADRRLRRAVRRALAWDARVPEGVYGDVTDGVLRLRGVVTRFAEREAAEDAVRYLIGVRDLQNEIKVAHLPTPDNLERDIEAALRRRFGCHGQRLQLTIADGVVTLCGVVPSFAMVEDIERAVHTVPGVTRVENQLVVD